MAVLIPKTDRLGLGLNTLTRNTVYAILALRGLTRSVTAYKDFINIAFSQTGDDDSIDLTFNASVKLLVQPEAVGTEGFNRLDYIKTLSELTPENPPALVAVEGVNPLPDNPEGLTLEKFIYWAGIVLGCSTYPSTDYYKETFEDKPSTGDPFLTLEFVIPLDYRRYLLNQNAIAASIQPFTVYVTDPGSLPSTPWVIPPSSQYWKDPVSDLAALTALTGLPIGVSVPVLTEGSVFTLISALPDGEELGENFLEPDTQSATEVWARSIGKIGPQGEPGTPGAGVTWHGEWDSGTAYITQDAVGHLGSSWIANAPNTNKTPGQSPEWDLWVSKGATGATGATGAAGNDGLTAYEVAVLNGFEGTEQAWLASLKGADGDPGPAGTISSAGSVTLEHIATPSAPSAGNTLIYAKADGGIYKRPAGGDEEAIGSGGGNFSPLTDKALYYYDAGSGLFKPVSIGTLDQVLVAKPSSNPPIQWATPTGGGRQALSANKNLYVDIATGSDSNDGSSDSPFATILKAVDVMSGTLDGYGYEGFIHIKGGTYSEVITLKSLIGFTNVTIQAWAGTGTVTLQNQHLFSGLYVGQYTLKNLVLNAGSGKNAIDISGGTLVIDGCTFGAGKVHLFCSGGTGRIKLKSYTINGGATAHYYSYMNGVIERFDPNAQATCTLTGTPAFTYFAYADRGGVIDLNPYANSFVFSGSATGSRYRVTSTGIIYSPTGGSNYYPGNQGGLVDTTTYGIYVG